MKYFLLYVLCSGICMAGAAQPKPAIRFTDASWDQLLAQARQEHKLIFMDAHAVWCGPCKWMDSHVFTDPAVAALYNRNFINAYTDMEKGEGIALRKKYAVRAYPTYLFINGDGEVVHKAIGQSTIPEFMQYGLDAISPLRNLQYLSSHYPAYAEDYDFVSTYLAALKQAEEEDSTNAVALRYLQEQDAAALQSPPCWKLLRTYLADASSPVFQYLVDHRQQYAERYGKEVEEKIHSTYLAWPAHYLHYAENGKADLDEKGFADFLSGVKKSDYEQKEEIIAKSHLTVFSGLKQWDAYSQTVSRMLGDGLIAKDAAGAKALYSYTDMIYRFGKKDASALERAVGFGKRISEEIPGINDQDKASYQELYADLLEESGKKDEAAQVRKQIDQQKLTQARQSSPFQTLQPVPRKTTK
jgi:thiol-disulfide isomerase/thioredoxin